MNSVKKIITCLMMGLCYGLSAQTSYSLAECIDFTLEHHPSMGIFENNEGIARAQTTQSIAGYLPQVNGSANFTDNLKLQTTVLPAGIFGPQPAEVQFGTQYNTVVGVDFNQTIYDQSKIIGIQAGKPYEAMTGLQQELNKETLIYNTAIAYFQVLILREQRSILESNKHKFEELVLTLTNQQKQGVVLSKEVDRLKVSLSTTNYQLEDVVRKEQLAVNSLKNAMGMALDQSLTIREDLDYESFASFQMRNELAIESLTSFKINEQQIALQEINVKMQRAKYLPSLNFVGRYAYQSLNNDFDQAFSDWNNFSYIGLGLKVPIFSGLGRYSKLHEEQLILENDRSNFLLNQRNMELNFENASVSVGTSYASFKSNWDNLNLAKELLEVTEYQYKQGAVGLIDFLNDDTAYKNAQSNYVNSLYNLMISQLNYQKAQGTLMEFIDTLK
ncbi:MAG: hypothetical protein CMB80_11090 [Flammeovirgaceae bacterium]|nr:hypothetical protein [Flammeovirgaceae bacterium]MBE61253.1 hypothetical protein [Flammeovirgaceae bacterium]MBR11170.1 hypothetical protein [Rickettsiales bacterium]HCX23954.1 hypothetical protein [Cytophagales bacterium]